MDFEARERKAAHESGELEPRSKTKFCDYFPEWIESYSGLTSRGFSETTRPECRRPIVAYAVPAWKGKRLSDIERGDVRRLMIQVIALTPGGLLSKLQRQTITGTSCPRVIVPKCATRLKAGSQPQHLPLVEDEVAGCPSQIAEEIRAIQP